MTAPVKMGDRVKVTLEGEVTRILDIEPGSEEVELRVEVNGRAHFVYTDTASVEKVEPEYEVFGPGTVVRSKGEGSVWAVGNGGYLRLGGAFCPVKSSVKFTSRDYELYEFQVG